MSRVTASLPSTLRHECWRLDFAPQGTTTHGPQKSSRPHPALGPARRDSRCTDPPPHARQPRACPRRTHSLALATTTHRSQTHAQRLKPPHTPHPAPRSPRQPQARRQAVLLRQLQTRRALLRHHAITSTFHTVPYPAAVSLQAALGFIAARPQIISGGPEPGPAPRRTAATRRSRRASAACARQYHVRVHTEAVHDSTVCFPPRPTTALLTRTSAAAPIAAALTVTAGVAAHACRRNHRRSLPVAPLCHGASLGTIGRLLRVQLLFAQLLARDEGAMQALRHALRQRDLR